ncbi:MAG: SUMF1/EgtB/PvdO family nonheme iron enzyme [Blastocatellia bacterium]|nr:SUMF1/EgtB/PvdO family nonheme iron enzyme [Blastocatellia bacterium]
MPLNHIRDFLQELTRPSTRARIFLRSIFAIFILAGMAVPSSASDLRIENVRFVAGQEAESEWRVIFDLSWQNGWHNSRNHDAAWVFLKFIQNDGYTHAALAPDGHLATPAPGTSTPAAQINLSQDRKGLFIHTAASYRGDLHWRLNLKIDSTGLDRRLRESRMEAFAVEMVYIPEGPFTLGDPDPKALGYGAFYRSDGKGEPDGLVQITSEAALDIGPAAGALYYSQGTYHGDRSGPLPATFPKGHQSFYVMKYEITQGQYAAFLNTLRDEATFERANFLGRSYYQKRGTISLEGGRYVAASANRPMNFMSWDDGLAFADWAALRPMTELEFTKACRGPEPAKPGEFPWGTSSRDDLARIVDSNDELVMTNGWNESRLTDETRPVLGASYYWVMDLAGSLWERVITVGSPAGRAFKGSHGDGQLDSHGNATTEDWPHTYKGAEGHGYRGGGFYDQGRAEYEFNPYSPIAWRRFGGWSGSYPYKAYGFRCARTAR